MGLDHPFALLSTYNKSAIANFAEDEEIFSELLQKGIENSESEPKKRSKENVIKHSFSAPAKPEKVLSPVSPESALFNQDFDAQNLKDISDNEISMKKI